MGTRAKRDLLEDKFIPNSDALDIGGTKLLECGLDFLFLTVIGSSIVI